MMEDIPRYKASTIPPTICIPSSETQIFTTAHPRLRSNDGFRSSKSTDPLRMSAMSAMSMGSQDEFSPSRYSPSKIETEGDVQATIEVARTCTRQRTITPRPSARKRSMQARLFRFIPHSPQLQAYRHWIKALSMKVATPHQITAANDEADRHSPREHTLNFPHDQAHSSFHGHAGRLSILIIGNELKSTKMNLSRKT